MTQRVTLLWNKMNPAKVSAYNVYREHAGNGDSLLTPVATTDTFYVDSNAIQDETYIYRVASVNAGDANGVKYTLPTQTKCASINSTVLVHSLQNGVQKGYHLASQLIIQVEYMLLHNQIQVSYKYLILVELS